MATSGSGTITVTDWNNLVFSWTLSGQSVANNTSTVAWSLKLVSTSNGRIDSSASKDWSVTVNGTNYSGTNTVGISNNTTKTLASGTTVIKHNDDGTKTFNYSFSQEFAITFSGSSIGTKSGSGSGTLTTIARASQPSCVTYPNHTQNVGDFGQNVSIHMNRKSSTFTHTVRYAFGSQTGTIGTGVGTGIVWTIPLTLMNLIPNATKGSGTIYVDTYNGSTKVGTKSCGFTATVPATIKPTCTVAVTDSTNVTTTYGTPVKGLSKFRVTVTPTQAYQSPIREYSTSANGSKYTTATFTTDFLKTSGTLTVSTTVTDSRGRTGTASKNMTVLNYTEPNISKLTVGRCDSDGTANSQGEYVQVTFSAAVTALNNKNKATYTVKYKKPTASEFTSVVRSAIANQYTVTNHSYIFAADTGSSYDVEVVVADNHSEAKRATTASTAFTLAHIGADGVSLALGKVSEKSGWLENNLPTENLKTHVQIGNSYTHSTPGVANQTGYIRMAQITVTGFNADVPMTFVFTRRQAASPMTVHITLRNSSTSLVVSTVNITYEGTNYGAFLQSTDKIVWNLYIQKGSAWDTICLQDWWMSKRNETLVSIVFTEDIVSAVPETYYRATPLKAQSLLDYIYPVNSVYISYSHTNPGTLFGGTWVRIQNAFLWGCDADGTIGTTGGAKEVTLTAEQIPAHTHNISVANTASGSVAANNKIRFNNTASSFVGTVASETAGGTKAHNNMPPYIQVSIWRRTA